MYLAHTTNWGHPITKLIEKKSMYSIKIGNDIAKFEKIVSNIKIFI